MLLNELIKQNFKTQGEAARAIGVHETKLSRALLGRETPSANFKKKVRDFFSLYFNETVEFIKDDAIIKNKDDIIKEREAEILALKRQLKMETSFKVYYLEQLTKLRKAMTNLAHDIDTFNHDMGAFEIDTESNTDDEDYLSKDDLPF